MLSKTTIKTKLWSHKWCNSLLKTVIEGKVDGKNAAGCLRYKWVHCMVRIHPKRMCNEG